MKMSIPTWLWCHCSNALKQNARKVCKLRCNANGGEERREKANERLEDKSVFAQGVKPYVKTIYIPSFTECLSHLNQI